MSLYDIFLNTRLCGLYKPIYSLNCIVSTATVPPHLSFLLLVALCYPLVSSGVGVRLLDSENWTTVTSMNPTGCNQSSLLLREQVGHTGFSPYTQGARGP